MVINIFICMHWLHFLPLWLILFDDQSLFLFGLYFFGYRTRHLEEKENIIPERTGGSSASSGPI